MNPPNSLTPIIAEYVWIDGNNNLRSKARTLYKDKTELTPADLPNWNYDGSSTGQATGTHSEIIIKPRAVFKDPFRGGCSILVMTDTYTPDGKPHVTNTRYNAAITFSKTPEEQPWFGMEQEFFLMENNKPLGMPSEFDEENRQGQSNQPAKQGQSNQPAKQGQSNQPAKQGQSNQPAKQGQYYCSVGSENAFGRPVIEDFYRRALSAGILVSGINLEVAPGQLEYQVGPVLGVSAGDQLWMSRYILLRVAETYGYQVNFDPKPIPGNWSGSGMHTNFSTESTRVRGGIKSINEYVIKLALKHEEHIKLYGEGNDLRLTGEHETCSINEFRSGVGDRGASVRIPTSVLRNKCGYLEDRRPASNADAYVVTAKIYDTCVL
jgi:glutamine synthetase